MRARYPLPRVFVACSLLGLAWELIHGVMDLIIRHSDRALALGIALAVVWAGTLLWAPRYRPALYGAIACGAVGCYWVGAIHFTRVEWHGPVAWMGNPEGAGARWDIPYNLLVYCGIAIGLGILWSGGRAVQLSRLRRGRPRYAVWFGLLLGALLALCGLAAATYTSAGRFPSPLWLLWIVGIGVLAAGVTVMAVTLPGAVPAEARGPQRPPREDYLMGKRR